MSDTVPVDVSQRNEIVEADEEDEALEDVVQQPVDVEVRDAVQGHHDDQPHAGGIQM